LETKSERAAGFFRAGCNCGQAVLAAFSEDYGITGETAMLLACGLGGGFRSGEMCGAAAASAMVIGLKHGNRNLEELDKKKECYGIIKAFMAQFKETNGALACRDILKRNAELGQKCDVTVKNTAALLEKEGY
jgi:C_GCAxxG_C_C family probable redox protein